MSMNDQNNKPHGLQHWLWLRISSLPLIPLFFFFLYDVDHLAVRSRAAFVEWIQQPHVAAALAVFIVCSFVHACLGVEEIVEDYVSSEKCKKGALCLNKIFFVVLGAACLYAVISLYIGQF